MAPVYAVETKANVTTTSATTYFSAYCLPSSTTYDCKTSSGPFVSPAPGWTAMVQYLEATRSTITDGGIRFGPLEMDWQVTPYVPSPCHIRISLMCASVSSTSNWDATISKAMPSNFQEALLATKLATADTTPDWLLRLPEDVQTYYLSASLARYITPVKYYEFIASTATKPSQSSVLVGAGASPDTWVTTSLAPSTMTIETTRKTTSSTDLASPSPSADNLANTTGPAATPSEEAAPTTVTSGQKAAISVSAMIVVLALIRWLVFYFKRIRPNRRQAGSEAVPPQTGPTFGDVKDCISPGFVSTKSNNQISPSELDGTSPVTTSGRNTAQHMSVELEGSPATIRGDTGFMIDAGVQMPSRSPVSAR